MGEILMETEDIIILGHTINHDAFSVFKEYIRSSRCTVNDIEARYSLFLILNVYFKDWFFYDNW